MRESHTDNYDDIINLPHHISKKHPPMPLKNRAAQFAPFAALTGFDDAIEETGRVTDEKALISEDVENVLDSVLNSIEDKKTEISVEFFQEDLKKSGGIYKVYTGKLKRVDRTGRCLIFEDGTVIEADDVADISVRS